MPTLKALNEETTTLIQPKDIHVLIAEDEPDLRDLLAAKFRVFGFQVSTAHNGTAAWDKVIEDGNIHIVITDIRMPNGTGHGLLQKCKKKNPALPKVFLISAFTDHTEEELFHIGSEGFINKPFDTKVLLDVVRKSLLKLEDRWRAQNADQPLDTIKVTLGDLKTSLDNKKFAFGRGGFFVETHQALPDIGTYVGFDVLAEPWSFKGTGILKWVSLEGDVSQGLSYAGIEVISLEGPSNKDIITWINNNNPQAYIPSPRQF